MRTMTRTSAALAIAVLGAGASASLATPAPGAPPAHLEKLPNGLSTLVLPLPGQPLASVQVVYAVGPVDETPETFGYAHLFKHLMFTGTAAVPDLEARIGELGGRTRSDVEDDLTAFETDAPLTAVDEIIAIEADRMRGLALTSAALERALAEVQSEQVPVASRTLTVDDVTSLLRPAAFAGHPYATIPEEMVAAAATVERARSFYDQHYRPDRACLVVAGGIDADRVLDSIRTHFGPLEPLGRPRPPLPPLPPLPDLAGRRLSIETGGPTYVAVGYRVPRRRETNWAAALLLRDYVNRSAAPSLLAALGTDRGDLRWLAAGLDETVGLFGVVVHLAPNTDPEPVLDQLAVETQRLALSADPQILATIRDGLRVSEATRLSPVSARAAILARALIRRGDHEVPAADMRDLAGTGLAGLEKLASDYLAPERVVTLVARAPAGSQGVTARDPGSSAGAPDAPSSHDDRHNRSKDPR